MSEAPGGRGLRYAPGLDGVRALAVLAVVAYHVGTTGGPRLLPGGYLGVDVFFVLSGYLITSLLVVEAQHTGRISIKSFYIRRARRLLPALFAVLLAVAAVGAFWLPQQAARLRGDLLASLGYVQNWWLIAQSSSYFATVSDRPPLLTHLWSLAVEEQYYLVWPLVLIGFARLRARPGIMLAVVLAGVAASTTVGQLLYQPHQDPSRVYYGTDTRALAPLLGAALAIAVRPWNHRVQLPTGARTGLDVLGLTALAGLAAVAATLRDTDALLYRGGLLVIALLAAGLVAAAGHPATVLGRVLGSQPLRYLGERSYAIYLWHWPVCLLTRPGYDIPVTGWANTTLRVALAIALAELSYQLIEKPIRRHGFLAPLRRPRPATVSPPGPLAAQPALRPHPARGTARVPTPRRPLAPILRTALLSVALVAGGAWSAIGLNVASRPAPAAAIELPTPTTEPSTPTHVMLDRGATVAFFGDSQATVLVEAAPANLGEYIHAVDASMYGCGIMTGLYRSRTGWERDQTRSCADWPTFWRDRFEASRPDLSVVMIGAWEVFDVTLPGGEKLIFGTDAWDRNFRVNLARAIAILHKDDRPVALALVPCFRPPPDSLLGIWAERGDDDRIRHLNDLIRAATGAYRSGVFTIEPPAQFCTGPVATDPDYRLDGTHVAPKGAALYFEQILPQIITTTPRTTAPPAPSVTRSAA